MFSLSGSALDKAESLTIVFTSLVNRGARSLASLLSMTSYVIDVKISAVSLLTHF